MHPDLIIMLRNLSRDKLPEAFLFPKPTTGKPYAKTTFQEIWSNACKAVGIQIKPYEGLRHSFASQRACRGIDLYLISKLLGHSERYAHTNLEELNNIMCVPKVSPEEKVEEIKS